MTKKRIIAIIALFMIIFQTTSPVIYAVEEEVKEEINAQIEKYEEIITKTQTESAEEIINEEGTEPEVQSNEEVADPEVIFANEGLKNYFVQYFDDNDDGIITASDMAQITHITLSLGVIESTEEYIDLKGLEYATALKSLEIWESCTNYSVLSNLENLQSLSVISRGLGSDEDYVGITQIPNLKHVRLSYIDFSAVNLYELPVGLETLSLSDCNLESVDNIGQFSNLSDLNISYNKTSTIQGLENINNLSKLKNLTIDYSNIEDISFLENNETVVNLNLSNNKIKNIDIIPTMKNLAYLYISNNQIEDITVLESMDSLSSYNVVQQLTIDKGNIVKGQILEIEIPKTIQCSYNQNSRFYLSDAKIESSTGESIEHIIISDDKTKITIDTTNFDLGEYCEELQVTGDGVLAGTTLDIKYRVVVEADNENELEITNEIIKQFLLENHNYDSDEKITAYDMAQITKLELTDWTFYEVEKEDWQILEYCINVEEISVNSNFKNFELLKNLPKLTKLSVGSLYENENYVSITEISNLKELILSDTNLENFNLCDLPESLEYLKLNYCTISEIPNIEKFVNLTTLNIYHNYGNSIQGLGNINKLPKLQNLSLISLDLEDISFLENNETITSLDLSYNKIKDISIIPTMKSINYIDLYGNQIMDMSPIADMTDMLNNNPQLEQKYYFCISAINKGEIAEIDLPQTIKDMYNPDSVFYSENISMDPWYDDKFITISEDKTKLIIDTTNLEIGPKNEYWSFNGQGLLNYMTIEIEYHVVNEEDNIDEIQFASEKVKQYILENHDINDDERITAYDMKQITTLYLSNISADYEERLDIQGIEYCTNLEYISLDYNLTNFAVLNELQNLTSISYDGYNFNTTEDYTAITQISNLKYAYFGDVDFSIYNLYDLPVSLENLRLSYCKIPELQNIEKFTNLTTLYIYYEHDINYNWKDSIQGLENINKLTKLEDLTLESIKLQDISFLENNETIVNLNLSNNKIKNIDVIPTMKKINSLYLYANEIEDMSPISDMTEMIENGWSLYQRYTMNPIIEKGEKIEIDLPKTIQDMYNSNSIFYLENANINNYTEDGVVTINEDKTKLIIDATNLEIGERNEQIYFYGDGLLSSTSIDINYTVIENADDTIEIEFGNESIKQYILEYYDIDDDDKITALDMAQIKSLYIDSNIYESYEEIIDLKGLEYAISLEKLEIWTECTNYSVLSNLQNLKNLYIYNYSIKTTEDYESITKIPNLKNLKLPYTDFTIFNLYDLPLTLESLEINGSSLTNIDSRIEQFSNLSSLSISNNYTDGGIQGLENINKLQNLKTLRLTNIGLENINFLQNNSAIEYLDVYANNINDISAISTLTNLKRLNIGENNLRDLSVIEALPDTVILEDISQNLSQKEQVDIGNNLEIDLPQILKDSFNPDYKFYVENASLGSYSYDSNDIEFSLNEDKTKLTLYTENLEVGEYYIHIEFNGNGLLSGTDWEINYRVIQPADNQIEITFENENFKNFFLENFDVDDDDKITAFDMAQITVLNLYWIDGYDISLEPLKYCISLSYLTIDSYHYTGFDVLLQLPKLQDLTIYWESDKIEEYNVLVQLENLKALRLDYIDGEIPIEYMPKNITKLEISGYKVNDYSCISQFTNLNELVIRCVETNGTVTGMESINQLSNLTVLKISDTDLIDISFLTDNENIQELSLRYNKIKDITPIISMKNIQTIDIRGNQIEDLSILENSDLLSKVTDAAQSLETKDIAILEGQSIEIETPPIIRSIFNPESIFYLDDIKVSTYNNNEKEQNKAILSEDGTKITLDVDQMPVDQYTQTIEIYNSDGMGLLSYTSIKLNYRVAKQADDTKEVQFGSEKIKNYILNYHDANEDGKITEYDMAQIVYLNLPYWDNNLENVNNENLQGLEYCISLKELYINIPATNYSAIKDLPNLESLSANLYNQNAEDYQVITNMQNLKSISISGLDFTNFNLYDLPTQIEELYLENCTINDIQGIGQFTNLKILKINYISGDLPIQGLNAINELTNLTQLSLEGTNLEDINFLNNNNTIENLYLSNNNIKDATPITTMTKLKTVSLLWNQIENIAVLNDMTELIENSCDFSQDFEINDMTIFKGEKIEIDLPATIRECFNEESIFYVQNAKISISNSMYNENTNITINDDKTKLIIDATNQDVGEKSEYIHISGEGKLSGTSIYVKYAVREKADDITPIEFDNKELEQYILNNYDIAGDGKITAYDMIQIKNLYISSFSIESLKGLEYAKNLESLTISVKSANYNEEVEYDFSQLSQLTKLKSLTIWGEAYKVETLSSLINLEDLTISLNYQTENAENQINQISKLTNLTRLDIYNGSISNIDALKTLSKLEHLSISTNVQNLENLNVIGEFSNLKYLSFTPYKSYGEEVQIDYSFLQKLINLEELVIEDKNTEAIDATNLANMTKLGRLTIKNINLTNVDMLSNLENLYYIQLDACKVTTIGFVKNLTKLNNIYMQNNFITDISSLEDLENLYYADFTNNPIGEIDEKYVNILEHIENRRIILTEISLTENLTFENEGFKNQLLNYSYDVNRDGEISKYEMSKIQDLYLNYCIENAQYLTNLKSLSVSYVNLTAEEQEKFIEQINLIREEAEISLNGFSIDLGNITEEQQYVELLLIKEMQNPNSRMYVENLEYEESYDEYNVAEITDGKIYFNEQAGDVYYRIRAYNETKNIYFDIRWKMIVEGDNTKVINIKDPALRQAILENHDIDDDGKITEHDMINISYLDIGERGVTTLKGLEYAKNLTDLYAYGNKIKDISPIVAIGQSGWYDLSNNEITDITCIANSKSDKTLNINLMDNYIDFLGNTKNIEVLKNDYEKSRTSASAIAAVTNMISSQRYGKPEDADLEVTLDSKIKQKLLEYEDYEIDTNNDNKFTRRELYNAYVYELDLSGLGLTNVNGLEYLNVYSLNLSNNNLTDITPLGNNRTIDSIDLSNNKIKDISCFANYNNFYWGKIDFSNNQIEDISSISTWPVMAQDVYNNWYEGWPLIRDIEIDLSNNNIKDIASVKDFKHIYKLDLSGNEITNIEPLASYNFVCYKDEEVEDEALDYFEGIFLDDNYINTQAAGNQKAIEVFKNKNVTLKLDNQKEIDVSTVFTDVKKTDWYYTAVQYNYHNMMIRGLNDTTFAPNQTLTRAMLVTILHRMEGMPYVPGLSKFADVQDTSAYYYVAVKWATQNGIVSGYNNGKFGPNDPITREQLAVILNNYCRYKGKYKAVTADLSKFKDADKISDYAKWGMNWAVGSGVITGNATEGTLNPQGTATRAEAASMLYKYCLNIK